MAKKNRKRNNLLMAIDAQDRRDREAQLGSIPPPPIWTTAASDPINGGSESGADLVAERERAIALTYIAELEKSEAELYGEVVTVREQADRARVTTGVVVGAALLLGAVVLFVWGKR